MSETINTMSVAQARQLLRDVSIVPPERVDEAQRTIDAFYAAKPHHQRCVACGAMVWSEHASADGSTWACAGCHRPPTLTSTDWFARQTSEREAADVNLRETAAAAPQPRQALTETLAKRAEARKTLVALEAAQPAARATLAAAVLKHGRSEAELAEVDGRAAEHLANSFLGGRMTGSAPSAMAARAALAAAADALSAARGGKALLDTQIADARTVLATTQSFARRCAISVLAAERLEDLLSDAVEARGQYIDTIAQLAWMLRHSAIPSSDERARQLVTGADVAPSSWPEAKSAGTPAMETALAALLADPKP